MPLDLAYVKGLRDYNDAFGKGLNKDAVIAVINQYTTVKDPSIARKMVPAALNPDGWVNLGDLLYKQSAYLRYGAVREPPTCRAPSTTSTSSTSSTRSSSFGRTASAPWPPSRAGPAAGPWTGPGAVAPARRVHGRVSPGRPPPFASA